MEVVKKPVHEPFKRWTCGACHKLLGIIYTNGILAVKYKDFTGYLLSGEFKTICRYCKSENNYKHKSIANSETI